MALLKMLVVGAVLIVGISAYPAGKKFKKEVDHKDAHLEYYHVPEYKYEYGVNDDKTHDVKKHTESRKGDRTEGEYSFHEADGTIRTVKYYVDGKSGFVATVHRTGEAVHPKPVQHKSSHEQQQYQPYQLSAEYDDKQ